MTIGRTAPRYLAFAALAIAVQALVIWPPAGSADKIRLALFFDCAVTIPACYWLLFVRSGDRGRASLAWIGALSLLRGAHLLSPRLAMIVAAAAEVALAVLLIRNAKRLEELLPSKTLRRILQAEFDVLRFALSWRLPSPPASARAFTIHEVGGGAALFYLLAAITPVEAATLHLLVHAKWVWITTALSLYSALWMMAIARSFAALPITVDSDGVTLRRGLLATLRVPADAIAAVSNTQIDGPCARFAVLSDPTLWIRFRSPLTLELPLGFTRQVTVASIAADQPAALREALASELNLHLAK